MDEDRVRELLSRYVEQWVVHDARLSVEDLAGGDPELVVALRARIEEFHRVDENLSGPAPLAAGTTLFPYRILEKIGAGGMGEVYRAEDLELGREVAIKVLPSMLALDPTRRARFEREARLLAALNHPAVASIYQVGRSEGLLFLVLELVPGETLAHRIARGALPLGEACRLLSEVAGGLEAAHAKGIVHRDLKPANIKITIEGRAKVLDFGLGKAFADGARGERTGAATISMAHTIAGTVVGTAAYMSPEQARGGEVDRRTDVWSFGCVLYEALTGRPAFPGETLADVAAAVLYRHPDWSALPAGTPASLRKLLARCLDKDSDRRLPGLAEARVGLGRVLLRPTSHRSRERWMAATAAVGVLAAVIIGRPRQKPAPPEATTTPSAYAGPARAEVGPGVPSARADRVSMDAIRARWRQSHERWRNSGPPPASFRAYVTTREPPSVRVLDPTSNIVSAVIPVPTRQARDILTGLAVIPDGTRLYVAAARETDGVFVVDTASNTLLSVPNGPAIRVSDEPHRLAITKDGKRAYVTCLSGVVSVIDTDPRSPTYHTVLRVPDGDAIAVRAKPRGIVIAPSGARAYVANALLDSVSVIDTDPRSSGLHRVVAVPDGDAIRVGRHPIGLGVDAMGTRLYVTSGLSDTLSVVDIDPRSPGLHTVVATVDLEDSPGVVAVAPDGSRAYVTLPEREGALVVDTASRAIVGPPVWVGNARTSFAMAPDGRRAFAARADTRDVVVVDTDPTSGTFHTILAVIPVAGMPFDVAFARVRPAERQTAGMGRP